MPDHRPDPRPFDPTVGGSPDAGPLDAGPPPRRRAFITAAGAATVLLLLLALLAPIYLSGSLPAGADQEAPDSGVSARTLKTREDLPEERRNEAAFENPEATAQQRAASAARRFVENVHNHEDDGRSPEDQEATYRSRVAEAVDPGGFAKSPGALQVDQRATAIGTGQSADVAARLLAFEPTAEPVTDPTGAQLTTGTLTYEVGTAFNTEAEDGTLLGEDVATYEQDLELVPWGAAYRVKSAGEPRPAAEGEEN